MKRYKDATSGYREREDPVAQTANLARQTGDTFSS